MSKKSSQTELFGKYLFFLKNFQKENNLPALSITDEKLVDEFIKKFNVEHKIMWFGANKCPTLNKALSFFYKNGFASRSIVTLNMLTAGFPKWVYCYDFNCKNGEMAYGFNKK